MAERKSILKEKSYKFAVRIVKLAQYLINEKKEYVLSKQIIRSGTAVGALVCEAEFAQSNADYINKFSVSLKEANETDFWLSLLKDSGYIDDKMYESISKDNNEFLSLLVSTIKTLKSKQK